MNSQRRIGLALAGIVVLIAAAALISAVTGDDDHEPATGATAATAVTSGAGATSADGVTGSTDSAARDQPAKPDPGPLLRAGEVTTVTADKDETVRFRARSAAADELHIHGYDRTIELPAGETVELKFKVTIEGVFEIELHNTGEQIGELRVNP